MKKNKTIKLTQLAIFTAIVIIFQLIGNVIPIGAGLNLVLIPITLGAIILGPGAGAFLGVVCGFVVLFTPLGQALLPLQPAETIIMCVLKTGVAGYLSGIVYKSLKVKSQLLGVLLSSAIVPIVNTSIFILGGITILSRSMSIYASADGVSVLKYVIIILAGASFFTELLVNLVVSPAINTVVNAVKKHIKH